MLKLFHDFMKVYIDDIITSFYILIKHFKYL